MNTKPQKAIGIVKGMGSLVKARFGAGMLLQHEDLDTLAAYTQELSRLMFRTLFGCGVMCGLVVKAGEDKCGRLQVTVAKGVALDCCGDPIEVAEDQAIAVNVDCETETPDELWVVLCAKYKCCAPRASMCATGEDDEAPAVCTRERYGYEIRVLPERPECACGCDDRELHRSDCKCANPLDPCYAAHYAGECGCACGGDCVVLARVHRDTLEGVETWNVSHDVRRFIRPVLMEDPQVRIEYDAQSQASAQGEGDTMIAKVVDGAKRAPRKGSGKEDA